MRLDSAATDVSRPSPPPPLGARLAMAVTVTVALCPLWPWFALMAFCTAQHFWPALHAALPALPTPLPPYMNLGSRLVLAAPALALGLWFNSGAKNALQAANVSPMVRAGGSRGLVVGRDGGGGGAAAAFTLHCTRPPPLSLGAPSRGW